MAQNAKMDGAADPSEISQHTPMMQQYCSEQP
jgi:hypothetical protein